MKDTVIVPKRNPRKLLPEDFKVRSWDQLKPYFESLLSREIKSVDDLRKWFIDRSELESVISEDLGWRYIYMTRYTDNEEYQQRYVDFVQNIQPQVAPVTDKLNRKALDSDFLSDLEKEEGFDILIRSLKSEVEIFREENIPLFTEIQTLEQQYGQISGDMTLEIDGQEMTLQQAAVRLQSTDRSQRKSIYEKIAERRLADQQRLDDLFDKLIKLRHQVAVNAGFANYRDYMFKAMGRFDYSPQDCFDFHESVRTEVVPMLNELAEERKEKLNIDTLRPYDKAVDPEGREALKPFHGSEELTEKTITCFAKLDPYLGECLAVMNKMGHLDLDSRKGKAPGGYNYPLAEIGVPFIFMNATSTLRDMVTILHEGGHAVHSFLTKDLLLSDFKETPSEIAELASMAMELISMDHWDTFFDDQEELNRAKKEHLEQIIETLPWVATIDKFQHWIYENPNHTQEERRIAWNEIFAMFSDHVTNWEGYEHFRDYLWQKQLHLFEVPFYYIEYGMAQLGAVAVYKNYKADNQKGLEGYMNALKLGYLKTIPEVYQAAGVKFDFSKNYISKLMALVKKELNNVN